MPVPVAARSQAASPRRRVRGFTLIEVLVTTLLVVIIAGMGLTIMPAMRRSAIQARAISRLKEFAGMQESFKGIGDLGLNADGSYGTFEELQNAGYIARDLVLEDDESHAPFAWLPYYKVKVGRDLATIDQAPDLVGYAITAEPIGTPGKPLPILLMEEDGEVFAIDPDGTRRVLR